MAGNKKFGTFSGVFTPSILTILGVILYMRMGWVVGNAGLVGAIIIVIIAHVISVSTGLSVSSVATDKKVGAGGIYYILSRSMGIPIGGAIGLALYVGTAFSIALYLIGFAESFNGYFGFSTDINGLRLAGSIALLVLTAIALISTSVALKTQFFILTAIVISLVSIFLGTWEFAPQTVNLFSDAESVPLEIVFAIFFPAVTGFTAGIAMSGNLEDPKRSIPVGTIAAIAVGFFVYIFIAIFLAYAVNSELLRTDYNVLMKIAFFSPVVVAGIWGATLSSALGGILGGPRILQAMSVDKVTPAIFGKGRGKENEPINALILVFVIAQIGILIGELDVIARVVSMFYLAAYGFINISFFLESWANPDFQPSFKVSRWIGLIGFLACFAVMFKLDMIAMFGSIIVIVGVHFWLQRKQIELETGNVWQSVWGKIVSKGLIKLDTNESKDGKWNPNIILFSGESEHRPYLLELSKSVAGKTGIVTNFNLIRKGQNDIPITKINQTIKEEALEKLGIFGRKIEVDNIYKGIENVATTFGFSGVDPNTVMMGWQQNTEALPNFMNMTQSLIQLDYNILFLDFDRAAKFGNRQTIDLWWRQTDSNNAEMMLNIARFIVQSPAWSKAKIRVMFVNNSSIDNTIIRSEISKVVERMRIKAEINVITNSIVRKDFYEIVGIQSPNTDLVLIGLPDEKIAENVEFIQQTDDLFSTIGTTLLVKASDQFNRLDFDISNNTFPKQIEELSLNALPVSKVEAINELILNLDEHLEITADRFAEKTLSSISTLYLQFVDNAEKEFEVAFGQDFSVKSVQKIVSSTKKSLEKITRLSKDFRINKLSSLEEVFDEGIKELIAERKGFIEKAPRKIKFELPDDYPKGTFSNKGKIYWKAILKYYYDKKILPNTRDSLYYFGVKNFSLVNKLAEQINKQTQNLIQNLGTKKTDALSEYKAELDKLFEVFRKECIRLETQTLKSIKIFERNLSIELSNEIDDPDFIKSIRQRRRKLKNKDLLSVEKGVTFFAFNWSKNQKSAHKQTESGLSLLISGILIYRVNERIKSRIVNTVIRSQQNKINLLSSTISQIDAYSAEKPAKHFDKRKFEQLTESIDYINLNNILDNEESNILSVSGRTSQTVELISADSFKKLLNTQGENVERLTLNLADIEDYIIQSTYLSTLQTTKKNLARITGEIAEEIYYSANLLNHVVVNIDAEEDTSDDKTIVKELKEKIGLCQSKLTEISESFSFEITNNLHNTIAELNIKSILESAESYKKIAKTSFLKPKIQGWYGEQKSGISGVYDKITGFVVKRKQEIDTQRFEVSNRQFLNRIEQTSNFVNSLSLKPEIQKEVPFYLKKLSVVGSLKKKQILDTDENLHSANNAINLINKGVSGAIIVLGESLSGKSFYTETIAKTFLKGQIVQINPPPKQNFDVNDIHFAFQKFFDRKGTAESILEQIPKKTVLIFNDLEKWWIKSQHGNIVINYLSKIIEDYGNKHYFLINSNIHSFQIIKQTTDLERNLLSTIVLSAATKSELRKVVLDRYNIAGVKLQYNGRPLNEAKKVDALFSDLYKKANGKIGLALNYWGSSIDKDIEGKLAVNMPKSLKFPDIRNPRWKIILYHLVIHDGLTEGQIEEIFNVNDDQWVLVTLKELEKAGLIYKQFNNSYLLNEVAKHFIENWLKESKILKYVNQ